jgi:hypothetical protein
LVAVLNLLKYMLGFIFVLPNSSIKTRAFFGSYLVVLELGFNIVQEFKFMNAHSQVKISWSESTIKSFDSDII